ncbi:hypothetical protein [uncultured Desulfovibrio sp.]|uniref:hypothetical protein n=1 Tax=uncultured Desulfovibrio sp. TaxID=167968 RepID=UPI0025DE798A|nr:hypothetical protein [uncultured Desulfovibrio sp.]
MRSRLTVMALLALCLALALAACTKKPRSTADIPRSLSPSYSIAVAPFTQPITTSQLIMGQLPKDQGRIAPEMLPALDMTLRDVLLTETKRQYTFIPRHAQLPDKMRYHDSNQPQALPAWVAFAKTLKTDLLLVPQVLNWHQREGSRAGVTRPAHVRVEFFLINIQQGTVQERSVYDVEQSGLTSNLLEIGDFLKRKGGWATADELAREGMLKAVKDLML